jgi:hypothetical protein
MGILFFFGCQNSFCPANEHFLIQFFDIEHRLGLCRMRDANAQK